MDCSSWAEHGRKGESSPGGAGTPQGAGPSARAQGPELRWEPQAGGPYGAGAKHFLRTCENIRDLHLVFKDLNLKEIHGIFRAFKTYGDEDLSLGGGSDNREGQTEGARGAPPARCCPSVSGHRERSAVHSPVA